MLHPFILQAPRLVHERPQYGRHVALNFGARQTWRPRQAVCIRHRIKVITHFHFTIIAGVVHAIWLATAQRCNNDARQIIGMDMIGVTVLFLHNSRHPGMQALQRQATHRIDAGDAQDIEDHVVSFCPGADLLFGIHPAPCPYCLWIERVCFVHAGAAAIAVYAAGADVDETPGQRALRQCGEKVAGARVGYAIIRRRSKVQHRIGQPGNARKTETIVQVARHRDDACRAQSATALRAARQPEQAAACSPQWRNPQRDVSTADDQDPVHAAIMR